MAVPLTVAQRIDEFTRSLAILNAAKAAMVQQRAALDTMFDDAVHPVVFMPPANHVVIRLTEAIDALTEVINRAQGDLDDFVESSSQEQ